MQSNNRIITRGSGYYYPMPDLNRDRLLVIVLAIFTALVLVACLFVLAPFVPALTWALALASSATLSIVGLQNESTSPISRRAYPLQSLQSVCLVRPFSSAIRSQNK